MLHRVAFNNNYNSNNNNNNNHQQQQRQQQLAGWNEAPLPSDPPQTIP